MPMDSYQPQVTGEAEATNSEPIDRSKYIGNRKPPPKDTRWKKGQSGNPGGRSKDIRNATQFARDNTHVAMKALLEVVKNNRCSASARVAAAGMLLDRAWGKPAQLNTNVNLDMRQAKDLTDEELLAIIAQARVAPQPQLPAPIVEVEPTRETGSSRGAAVGRGAERLSPSVVACHTGAQAWIEGGSGGEPDPGSI